MGKYEGSRGDGTPLAYTRNKPTGPCEKSLHGFSQAQNNSTIPAFDCRLVWVGYLTVVNSVKKGFV